MSTIKRPPYRRRRTKATILIVGEGEVTEPTYFRGLCSKTEIREAFCVTIKGGQGKSRTAIVDCTIKHSTRGPAPYDHVYCVMDAEGIGDTKQFSEALVKAKRANVNVILSNPSFEVWLLAHFIRTCRSFLHADDACKELDSQWQKEFHRRYAKNDLGLYTRLDPKVGDAILNARQVREQDFPPNAPTEQCNSSTDVYRLVAKLLGQPASSQ